MRRVDGVGSGSACSGGVRRPGVARVRLVRLLVGVALVYASLAPILPAAAPAPEAAHASVEVNVDPVALQREIDAHGTATLPWFAGHVTADVRPADLFASDYRSHGPHGPVATAARPYEGTLRGVGGAAVRLTVTPDWVMGLFLFPGGDTAWLERVEGAPAGAHRLGDGFDFHHQVEDLGVPPTTAARHGPAPSGALVENHNCPLGLRQLYNTPLCPHHNEPPSVPDPPSGPSSRSVGETGTYCATSTDPDGDSIQYVFTWDDGGQTTTGYYTSGTQGCADHAWSGAGSYCVTVYAQDTISPVAGSSGCTYVSVGGGGNRSPGKAATPSGPTSRTPGQSGDYATSATDPDGDNLQYIFDWGDGSGTCTSSWASSGSSAGCSHAWSGAGTYCVKAYAQDTISPAGPWSDCLYVTVSSPSNHAPGQPGEPSGPASRTAGESGTYSASATDADGDSVRYHFDWGDSSAQCVTAWVASGSSASCSHSWASAGTYCVEAYSEDTHNAASAWSVCHSVTVSAANQAPTSSAPWGPQYAFVGRDEPYVAWVADADGDAARFVFQWGDGSSTASDLVYGGSGHATATHAFSSAATRTVCGYAEDAYGHTSATSCAARSTEVSGTRVKAEYLAIADASMYNQYPSDWNSRIAGYVNNVNGMLTQTDIDVELVITATDALSWNDAEGSTCATNLDGLRNWERYEAAYAELVQGFVYHAFDSSGTLGCARQDGYASSSTYHSVVSVKSADSWPSGVSETAGHEVGHGLHGQHADASTWWESGAWHEACSIMWSADANDPSPGYCYHQHLEANAAEKTHFHDGAHGSQGQNEQPRLPILNLQSNDARTLVFHVQGFDPDQDRTRFYIDWGDGGTASLSAWGSGGHVETMQHTFGSTGGQCITAGVSDWSWGTYEDSCWSVYM